MSTLRSVLGRTTQQAAFGLMIIGTMCVLALRGDIDGPTFVGVGLIVVAYLYKQSDPKA